MSLSKNYQSKSAAAKQEELFNNVKKEKGTSGVYEDKIPMLGWLLTEDRSYVVSHDSDENPVPTFPWSWYSARVATKRIHSVGNVATVKYESIGTHSYTGMFKGADHALVRLSLAEGAKPEATTPGIGVKFFRDGMKSANFVAMYTLNGQQKGQKIDNDAGNFFANPFSNHVPDPNEKADGNTPVALLAKQFAKVYAPATMVGISDIGKYTPDGKEETNLNFPCALYLKPNPELTARFKGTPTLTPIDDYLSTIVPGTTLYEVWGMSSPSAEKVLIGKLTTTSELISSLYGDKELFFQHQNINEDFKLRPEWKKVNTNKNYCPFTPSKAYM